MTKPLNQLLEEAMKKCDSTMKETIDDYLYLRREASNDLDELRKALEEAERWIITILLRTSGHFIKNSFSLARYRSFYFTYKLMPEPELSLNNRLLRHSIKDVSFQAALIDELLSVVSSERKEQLETVLDYKDNLKETHPASTTTVNSIDPLSVPVHMLDDIQYMEYQMNKVQWRKSLLTFHLTCLSGHGKK